MVKKYNPVQKGDCFKGAQTGKIYKFEYIKLYVIRYTPGGGKTVLRLLKPKTRIDRVIREICLVPVKYGRGILLKDLDDSKRVENSWIIKQGNCLVDDKGRLKISYNEKLTLIKDERH